MNLTHIRFRYYCLLLITLVVNTSPILCDDEFDDFLNNPDVIDVVEHTHFQVGRNVADNDVDNVLIDVGGLNILRQFLYCHTHPFNKRNIIDSPLFWVPVREYFNGWIVSGHLFWNMFDREFFTRNSSNISSYLAINSPDLLDAIQSSPDAQRIFQGFGLSPLDVLPLFNNATIQERKFGVMFAFERQYEYFDLRFWFPLYYVERNFWLTEAEQEALEDTLGKASEEDKEAFGRNHLVSDKFGFGDTKLTLQVPIFGYEEFSLSVGLISTIPTAFPFASGLLGRKFRKPWNRPELDFNQLFDLAKGSSTQQDQASAMAECFMLTAIDTFGAILLETELGNGKHFSLGAYFDNDTSLALFIPRPWADRMLIQTRMAAEHFFPAQEIRAFVEQSDYLEFQALGLNQPVSDLKQRIDSDPDYAHEVLLFLQTKTTDRLIPFAFCSKVKPGVTFHSTIKLFYESPRAGFYLGTDFWVQGQEKLSNIQVRNVPISIDNLDIAKATRPMAYQCKVIGSLFHKVPRPTQIWTLGIEGDKTFASSGIGRDFTISLNIEVNF